MTHPATEWQDISTAPKDGFQILVCNASSDLMPHWCAFWIEAAGWVVWSDLEILRTCQPTHWMPLPSPPTQDKTLERAV